MYVAWNMYNMCTYLVKHDVYLRCCFDPFLTSLCLCTHTCLVQHIFQILYTDTYMYILVCEQVALYVYVYVYIYMRHVYVYEFDIYKDIITHAHLHMFDISV